MSCLGEEYYCPNCDAVLTNQIGFDPDIGIWTCTECGQTLYGDDVEKTQNQFEGVVWYCDSCGAVLSTQIGFNDSCGTWECTVCGEINNISDDEIYESELDYSWENQQPDESEDCQDVSFDEEDDEFEYDEDAYYQSVIENAVNEVGENYAERNLQDELINSDTHYTTQNPSILKKFWYHLIRKKFKIGISSDECIGSDFRKVVSQVSNSGFEFVHSVPSEELSLKEIDRKGLVKSISINGYSTFSANAVFPFNAKIVINYYTLMKVTPPYTSSQAKGKNYMDVISAFRRAGFDSFETRIIYDLIFGWLKKDGAVEQISINGCNKFDLTTSFRLDAKIVVTYHTFKNR